MPSNLNENKMINDVISSIYLKYASNNEENDALFTKYKTLVDQIPGFYLLGRLAEYKYYNIDAIVDRALTVAEQMD